MNESTKNTSDEISNNNEENNNGNTNKISTKKATSIDPEIPPSEIVDPVAEDANASSAVKEEAEMAAAIATTSSQGVGDSNTTVSDNAPAAAATTEAPSAKRRFFPRLKHLLTPDWENFLLGVLQSMENSGAPFVAAASHKATNPWYKAFHSVYGGVASDCSVPTGKNRYHKFKDKIVELWTAMEQTESHRLKEMAVRQLQSYRHACDAKLLAKDLLHQPGGNNVSHNMSTGGSIVHGSNTNTNTSSNSNMSSAHGKTTGLSQHHPAVATAVATTKRSSMAIDRHPLPAPTSASSVGGATASNSTSATAVTPSKRPYIAITSTAPIPPQTWSHLDEGAVLATLPQPLQNLVHLRYLGVEVQSPDSQRIEAAYQQALKQFLDAPCAGKSASELYATCQSLVVLWRCAKKIHKLHESKCILYSYNHTVHEYLQAIQRNGVNENSVVLL